MPIKNIVIAGGGTAGWSTAAILSSLNNINITVLDPSDIPTIGVGESTLPHIHKAHQKMGFDIFRKQEWLDSVDGTVKLTIEFADFYKKDSLWVHPFFDAYGIDRQFLTNTLIYGVGDVYDLQEDFMFANTSAGRRRKRGFIDSSHWFKNSGCTSEAAFHINAVLYAKRLKELTSERSNVTVLNDSIGLINHAQDGSIESVRLKSGVTLSADMFVDCTGSRALLLNAVEEPWISANNQLFVDGAWLVQLPHIDKNIQLRNTTYCHALSSGWVFNIPLQSRIGTGYIFSSAHQTDEAAAQEFANHLSTMYGYDKEKLSFKRLRFPTGYRKRQWVKNVIGIGMSSFFCEPLESTAIAMANSTALCLREALINQHVDLDLLRTRLNNSQHELALSVLDFVEMHYTLTEREDSNFWQDYKNKPLTDFQTQWLDLYSKAPNKKRLNLQDIKSAFGDFGMFCNVSYAMMFYGYNIKPAQIEV